MLADGGAFRIAAEGDAAPAEVIVAPGSAAEVAQGQWQVLNFGVAGEPSARSATARPSGSRWSREKGVLERQVAWNFFLNGDSREAEQAGILGSIMGSLMVVFVTIALSLPIGVAAAIYLEEFAPKNRLTEIIEVNINNLAAVPSIIFGLLGLAVFLGFFGMPRSVPLVGGIVIALMSLPTIIIASRAAIRAVPPSIREAALGVGASHQQAVFHHVLPLAMPGIMTGTILGGRQRHRRDGAAPADRHGGLHRRRADGLPRYRQRCCRCRSICGRTFPRGPSRPAPPRPSWCCS